MCWMNQAQSLALRSSQSRRGTGRQTDTHKEALVGAANLHWAARLEGRVPGRWALNQVLKGVRQVVRTEVKEGLTGPISRVLVSYIRFLGRS